MNSASELERYLAAERAYSAAKEAGADEAQAKAAAQEAAARKRQEQMSSRLGVDLNDFNPKGERP